MKEDYIHFLTVSINMKPAIPVTLRTGTRRDMSVFEWIVLRNGKPVGEIVIQKKPWERFPYKEVPCIEVQEGDVIRVFHTYDDTWTDPKRFRTVIECKDIEVVALDNVTDENWKRYGVSSGVGYIVKQYTQDEIICNWPGVANRILKRNKHIDGIGILKKEVTT